MPHRPGLALALAGRLCHEVKATFRSALDRMKEYDDFNLRRQFRRLLRVGRTVRPAMFAEISSASAKAAGRFVGGWWIEPDCNIPSGESSSSGALRQRYSRPNSRDGARRLQCGQLRSCRDAAANFEQKRHPYYNFLRPMPHEKSLPSRLFWWES